MNRIGRMLIPTGMLLMTAVSTVTTAQTQVSATITQVSIYSGVTAQGAILYITPAVPNLEGCTNTPGNLLWIDFSSSTQPDGRSLYATVLAALATNQRLAFGVSGCGDGGQVPTVYRIDFFP